MVCTFPLRIPYAQELKPSERLDRYPPMQKGATVNLDAVKAKIAEAMAKNGQ